LDWQVVPYFVKVSFPPQYHLHIRHLHLNRDLIRG
jgi:hypothetical protein